MKATCAIVLGAMMLLGGAAARAEDATGQAKMLFNMGAQAYNAENYPAAIRAFEEAYRAAPRPGIVFSMAQAYRRQYFLDRKPENLRSAVRFYREYLAKVEQGGRRAEAAEALNELEAGAARLDAEAPTSAPPPLEVTRPAKPITTLMVSSQTKGAQIALDDSKPSTVPLISEVSPGKHRLRMVAGGYFTEERDIEIASGGIAALDISLRERPAQLSIKAMDGAQILVDGRQTAQTPLSRPIEIESGHHTVALTRNGYQASVVDIDVQRDETRTIEVKLERSRQRTASFVLFGTSTLVAAAAGVALLTAVDVGNKAMAINNNRFNDSIDCRDASKTPCDRDTYLDLRAKRQSAVAGMFVVGGLSLAIGTAGFLAFAFDEPSVGAQDTRPSGRPAPLSPSLSPRETREMPLEVSVAPILGPGLYGAGVSGRF